MPWKRWNKKPSGFSSPWGRGSGGGKKKKSGGRSRQRGNRYSFTEALALTMNYLSEASSWSDDGIDDEDLLALDPSGASQQVGTNDVLLGTVRGHIVGIQYYKGTVNNNEMVSLVREPNNQYDRNAVKVENVYGQQVGHIKRQMAEALSYIVDNNYARIDGVVPNGSKNMYSMPVDIALWGPSANRSVVTQRLRSRGFPLVEERAGFSGTPSTGKSKSKKSSTYNPRSALGQAVILSQADMRSELDTLFDNLKCLDKTTETQPAACITSKMYPHQKQALNWMLAREANDQLPPFWELTRTGNYHNSLTNFTCGKKPDYVRGGILADEMGLGKTLSVIALILHEFVIPEYMEEAALSLPMLPEIGGTEDDQMEEQTKAVETDVKEVKVDLTKVCQQPQVIPDEVIVIPDLPVVPPAASNEVIVLDDDEEDSQTSLPGCSTSAVGANGDAPTTTASGRPKRASAMNVKFVFSDHSEDDCSPQKKAKVKPPKKAPKAPKVKGQSARGKGSKSKKCEVTPTPCVSSSQSIPSTSSAPQISAVLPLMPKAQAATASPMSTQPMGVAGPSSQPIRMGAQSSQPIRAGIQSSQPMGAGLGAGDSSKLHTTLIICPLSVLSNWIDQFGEHVADEAQVNVSLYYGPERKKLKANDLMKQDVVITTYNTMAAEYKAKKEKSVLHKVEWLRVVLDEAHTIRNHGTQQTQAAHALNAQRKWALTGTPIQNSIKDLWSLVAFLGVEPFKSSHNWWQRIIARPIADNNSCGIERVRRLVETLALRRMKSQKMNGKPIVDLPARNVVLQYIDFSEDEKKVYKTMEQDGRLAVGKYFQQGTVLDHYGDILAILMRLRQLSCHPALCAKAASKLCQAATGDSEKTDEERAQLVATLVSFLSQGADEECCICLESIEDPVITRCAHVFCQRCIGEVIVAEKDDARCPLCRRPVSRDTLVHVPKDRSGGENGDMEGEWHSSAKVDALMECMLKERAADSTIKSIVVSQFTSFLDLVQKPLTEKGFTFTRLDGSMSSKARTAAIRQFSDPAPNSPQVFLLSLKAGGVGLNLTAASRLYLLDPAWNPACEEQCFDRCHRLGQTRDVTVTKFIVRDTVEESMLALQEKKRQLMKTVFDGKKQTPEERRANRVRDIKILMGFNNDGTVAKQ